VSVLLVQLPCEDDLLSRAWSLPFKMVIILNLYCLNHLIKGFEQLVVEAVPTLVFLKDHKR